MFFCKYMSIALVLHGLGIICSLIFHDAWICNSPGRLTLLKRYPKVTYLLNRVRPPPLRKGIFFRTPPLAEGYLFQDGTHVCGEMQKMELHDCLHD